jgi:hypothetical protein
VSVLGSITTGHRIVLPAQRPAAVVDGEVAGPVSSRLVTPGQRVQQRSRVPCLVVKSKLTLRRTRWHRGFGPSWLRTLERTLDYTGVMLVLPFEAGWPHGSSDT